MTDYLDLEDLLEIARTAVGGDPAVRDYGLLESVLARSRTPVFGADAYSDLHLKAAALSHCDAGPLHVGFRDLVRRRQR